MAASIQKISFDRCFFPLSPFAQRCEIRNNADHITLYINCLPGTFNQYAQNYKPEDRPHLHNTRHKMCNMIITAGGVTENPHLVFDIVDLLGVRMLRAKLNLQEYTHEYERATRVLADLKMPVVPAREQEFERSFAAEYLSDHVFKGRVSGPGDFWKNFYDMIDMATIPIMARASVAQNEHKEKPVIIYDLGPVLE